MSSAEELIAHTTRLLRGRLIERHRLEPRDVPAEFAARAGDWNGRPVMLHTQAWSGAGAITRVHVATATSAEGGMASLTCAALPSRGSGAPILGVDLVSFGGRLTTAVVDLAPTSRELAEASAAALRAARDHVGAVPPARLAGPFSEHVFAALPPTCGAAALGDLVDVYVEVLSVEVARPSLAEREEEASVALDRYLRGLGDVKKQGRALGKLFGAEWVERYFDELFLNAGEQT